VSAAAAGGRWRRTRALLAAGVVLSVGTTATVSAWTDREYAAGALVAASEANGATLIASLHAVDLALKWFPRLIGMKGGEVVFDRPTAAVTTAMLHELYATEGRALPVQGVAAEAGDRGANVLVLRRPGCQ